jgi:hypothetical protein
VRFPSSLHSPLPVGDADLSLAFAWVGVAQWYMWIGNPVLATGIMSFLLHEVSALVPL